MNTKLKLIMLLVISLCITALAQPKMIVKKEKADPNSPPGGIILLEGYQHKKLQGIDSLVGEILKKDGLKISYELGRIARPGQPRMGGDFTDRAKGISKNDLKWFKKQTIDGSPAHIAFTKKNQLIVSFPTRGGNFRAKIESEEQMADALLMTLTYPLIGKSLLSQTGGRESISALTFKSSISYILHPFVTHKKSSHKMPS